MTIAPLACLILAGGKGTRMKSSLPKLLHEACGRTLIDWTLHAAGDLEPERVVVIVPPDDPELVEGLPEWAVPAVQEVARGTGDAVASGRTALEGFTGVVVCLNGDHPLTDPQSLRDLVEAHTQAGAQASVMSLTRSDDVGKDFGRIVRDEGGEFLRIVEVKDATDEERAITEVSTGIFAFDSATLWPALERLTTDNAQGELYITDVIEILRGDGGRVVAHTHSDPTVALGVNTQADLAEAAAILRSRINHRHMLAGVRMVDPATTYIDDTVEIEPDVTLHPFTTLRGATTVASGAEVGPQVVAIDATIGEDALVGPFCYLRPGAELGARAKAGTYVEIKNSSIGEDAKVPHLSYIGDAEVGAGTNIGAGGLTANYDGKQKQRTVIGKGVHTACDNVFVAPVTIGDGAWIAAGSVITDDVPPDALGVARARQKNIEGYGKRKRR
jgi:bifunctional UDP-N-acetylglucosamine pyrophosphorylase / glucosamine-1-phosphate N-acetyltransferase